MDDGKSPYEYFMRPEPRENLSKIRIETDPILGSETRVRTARIGMTRNASDENKKEAKVYLDPIPHIRIDKAKDLQGWYKNLHEKKGVRPRPCFTESILTEPYGGWCTVGCCFCYINSGFRGYRGTGLMTVPLDYGSQVRKQLAGIHRGAAGYFTSFTDPFLPLEKYYHNSQEGAKAFVEVGLPIFFLSRLRYPLWAINLLRKNPHSYAQKSINTPIPRDWKLFSPGALPLGEHFEEITKLRRVGVYVSIQVNPVIPGVTSHQEIEQLFKMLAAAGANHVIVKFVEAGYSWAPAMVERIRKRFGEERGSQFDSLFQENIGGQRTIVEKYRLQGHKRYSRAAKALGLTYATCYEYRYDRDEEGNITDRTGYSIGRAYTTADQCHGHRVPVYRDREGAVFVPVDDCPPEGCLYCAAENEGEPRCGDSLAGEAKALRLLDLRKPINEG